MRSVEGMKKCSHCKAELSVDDFYNNRHAIDGKCPECKTCHTARVKKWREENPDKRKRMDAEYRGKNPERYRKAKRVYVARHAKEKAERSRQFRISNPEKARAHAFLNRAVKSGKIIRPTACEVCGSTVKIEAHHTDYSMPYLVQWLCKSCHNKADRERLEGEEVWETEAPVLK